MIELELPIGAGTANAGGGPDPVRAGHVTDDDGFERWYASEHPRLLAAMVVVTRDLHVAQDVTAEAFARALAAWHRVVTMDSPTGWTYRVAVNVARRRARRAALEARLLGRAAPVDGGVPPERALELWDAVRTLPPRARTAIALRYAAEMTEAEVADAMQISVGAASATLSQARRALAALLADDAERTTNTNDESIGKVTSDG